MDILDINKNKVTISAESVVIKELGVTLADAVKERLIPIPKKDEESLNVLVGMNALIKGVVVSAVNDGGESRAEGEYKDETLYLSLYNMKGEDGKDLTFDDLTEEQKQKLRGEKGDALRWEDLTEEQKEQLKGEDGHSLTYYDLTEEQKEQLRGKPGKDAEVTDMSEMNDKKAPSVSAVMNYIADNCSKKLVQGTNVTFSEENGKIKISASLPAGTATSAEQVAYGDSTVKSKLDELSAGSGGGMVTMYVSAVGNDSNNGLTEETSKATVNAALEAGASVVIVKEGDYSQSIDISKTELNMVTIKGERGGSVIFRKNGNLIFNDGAETPVGGYDNIVMHDCNIGNYKGWLYCDNLDDETTKIADSERHPSQRGKFYRCESTKMVMSEKTTLNDALADISSSAVPKWYYADGKLYYRNIGKSDVYPIYKCDGNVLTTSKAKCKDKSLIMSNIEMRYGGCLLSGLNYVRLENCSAKYVHGTGAIVYDNCISATFVACEASSCHYNSLGDGFNAHGSTLKYKGAKCVTARLMHCWSHDNNDDGYSDHEFSETIVDGGLYEWNGKAGLTPAYGSHCMVSNVLSRHNYSGIYYTGNVDDGQNGGDYGNKGQMICYNCVTEQNDRGTGNKSKKCGYVVGEKNCDNSLILVNCIAVNEVTGYKCMEGNTLKAFNCSAIGCTANKEGEINIINPEKL